MLIPFKYKMPANIKNRGLYFALVELYSSIFIFMIQQDDSVYYSMEDDSAYIVLILNFRH